MEIPIHPTRRSFPPAIAHQRSNKNIKNSDVHHCYFAACYLIVIASWSGPNVYRLKHLIITAWLYLDDISSRKSCRGVVQQARQFLLAKKVNIPAIVVMMKSVCSVFSFSAGHRSLQSRTVSRPAWPVGALSRRANVLLFHGELLHHGDQRRQKTTCLQSYNWLFQNTQRYD